MTTIKVLNRPIKINKTDVLSLDNEFKSAIWCQNRFIDFEIEHQNILNLKVK